MKTLALILSLVLTTSLNLAQDNIETYSIAIKIDNALNNDGHMLIGLHNADTFMKGKGIQNSKSKITDGVVNITFENVTPGIYAIMVLHDANDNGKMDFDTSGMPKESYGMSNNPMLFGPPTFTDAKFELLNEDKEIIIRF
ncbi:DUF2141 domain-containing protein [Formosa maritima]|uniref:DUF2141 domain-containing protein n=1 Tax=Formosa maritima TaxID=2592046 RepID=A0A5D0G7H8_9FLAO|nr:DUF2141 domain-containing protein [Formosa maritima]TYA53792.1 DUF2141 domain-containing protein [Formosa maritima]